jgi:hypothetical protein
LEDAEGEVGTRIPNEKSIGMETTGRIARSTKFMGQAATGLASRVRERSIMTRSKDKDKQLDLMLKSSSLQPSFCTTSLYDLPPDIMSRS